MLKHPTLDKLHALKLTGMAAALADCIFWPIMNTHSGRT
jgi:hypothetical protein